MVIGRSNCKRNLQAQLPTATVPTTPLLPPAASPVTLVDIETTTVAAVEASTAASLAIEDAATAVVSSLVAAAAAAAASRLLPVKPANQLTCSLSRLSNEPAEVRGISILWRIPYFEFCGGARNGCFDGV